MQQVGQQDKNLPALLASCKPLAVEGNILVIGFDYLIIKEKFDNKDRAREQIAGILSQMAGVRCLLRTVLTEQYIPAPKNKAFDKNDLTSLAQELGGVVSES
jgi:hypothetical protein